MPFRKNEESIYCGSKPEIRQFVEDFLIHIWNEAVFKLPVLNVQDDEIKLRKFLLLLNEVSLIYVRTESNSAW